MSNAIFQVLEIVIIIVAAIARVGSYVTNIPLLGGVLACGIILLLGAILGIVGTARLSYIALRVYIPLLLCLVIVQFAVSVSALAMKSNEMDSLLAKGWCSLDVVAKNKIQVSPWSAFAEVSGSSVPMPRL